MSLAIELALDRIEAAIAAELPAHVTAFARAHAAGTPAPPAPVVVADPTTLATAERALAARDPGLERRGRSLWRQCALLAIENDREVARRRAAGGGWPELAALATARDTAARARWGRGFLAVAHDVFEVPAGDVGDNDNGSVKVQVSVDDNDNDNVKVHVSVDVNVNPAPLITELAVVQAWTRLTDLPPPEIVIADARPRTFAVRRGAAIVVVPATATVTAWSQALHELGHAWVAIAGRDLPRTLDEAVAITAARTLETRQPSARDVHARQHRIAVVLAEAERALYSNDPSAAERARAALAEARGPRPEALAQQPERPPPWALWHDPGAQAAYVAAEAAAWRVERLDELRSHLP